MAGCPQLARTIAKQKNHFHLLLLISQAEASGPAFTFLISVSRLLVCSSGDESLHQLHVNDGSTTGEALITQDQLKHDSTAQLLVLHDTKENILYSTLYFSDHQEPVLVLYGRSTDDACRALCPCVCHRILDRHG